MKKAITTITAILATTLILTGCSSNPDTGHITTNDGTSLTISEFTHTLKNGKTVECIYVEKNANTKFATGGPSCNRE